MSSIGLEDVRNTRRCCHVVNLANRETAVVISARAVAARSRLLSKRSRGTVMTVALAPVQVGPIFYPALEVCTGSKLKPEPGPYPRSSDPTRPEPPPQRIANKKKRKKAAFHDCMQRNGLIKALPFHKHLPVMTVCEHQAQRSHTFCRGYEFCKLWSFFLSVKAR